MICSTTDGAGVVGTKSKGDQIAAHGTMGGESTGQGVQGAGGRCRCRPFCEHASHGSNSSPARRVGRAVPVRCTGAHGEPSEAPLLVQARRLLLMRAATSEIFLGGRE